VHRCLAKDPVGRFQSASDLSFALSSVSISSDIRLPASETPFTPERPPRRRWLLAAAAGAAAVTLGALIGWALARARQPTAVPMLTEFLVPTPTGDHVFASLPLPGLLPTAPQVGLSPDGRWLAFVSTDTTGSRSLWIRAVNNSRPRAVEGTEAVTSWPFWSHDSRHVVIAARQALIKVDVTTGTTERLCALPEQAPAVPFVTGTSNAEGTILFSVGGRAGLYRVSASGGRAEAVTTLDTARGDQYHSWPQFVSNDRFLLFVRTDDVKTNGVYAGSLGSPEITLVMANPTRAVYSAGHLLWSMENRLVAQPFDASRLQLTGQSATVVPSVFEGAGRTAAFWASSTDVIAYAAGDTRERQFRWFDRTGGSLGVVGPPGLYVTFDLSPDSSRVVAEVTKERSTFSTLMTFDVARGVLAPLTLGNQHDSDPRFGPDGDVVFARNTEDGPGIVRVNPTAPAPSIIFPRAALPVVWVEDWATDGSSVVFRSGASPDAFQIATGSSEPTRLTRAREPIEQVQFSPNGRLITYSTAESGQQEVFVAPVPFTGERWQISVAGGVQPTWRKDGRELYYLGLDGGLYAVEIRIDQQRLQAGRPERLFSTTLPVISAVVEQYRPTEDGQRFLFCLP
jgi:Tol biopolymer transport system component